MSELTMIRTDCESEFDRVYRDAQFFATLMEQNREMENFVNESLIKASGNKRAINEMYIINEAAAGDKIKAFFEKIKNFFKKIFDKLGASMNALFQEQKKFIEQYQYICTKCKYKAGDVNDMKNHFVGFPRILATVEKADQMILGKNNDFFQGDGFNQDAFNNDTYKKLFTVNDKTIDFSTVDSIRAAIANPPEQANLDELRRGCYDEFVKDNGWEGTDGFNRENDANGNINIDTDFRSFFDGSKDGMSFDLDSIENQWQTVLNTVYGGEAYLKTLGKINDSVVKQMDQVEKSMTTYIQNQKNKINTAVSNLKVGENKADKQPETNPNPNQPGMKDINDKQPNPNQPGMKDVNESYLSYNSNNIAFNEMNINAGSAPASEKTEKGQPMTGVGSKDNETARKTQSDISGKKLATANAKDVNITGNVNDDADKKALQDGAEKVLNIIETNAQAQVNANIQISSAISRQLYNAFQLTNKDFWSIIKAHVNWYLGNPGQEKQSENIRSNPTNLSMNAGTNAKVGKEQPAPQPTEQSAK